MTGAIEVDGLKEFQRETRRAVDTQLPKRLGEAHKDIGKLVISRLNPRPDPAAVGSGKGADVRPTATKREVLLRVGGAHRASGPFTRMQPWGRVRVGRIGIQRPPRPHIIGTVERHRDEIGTAYLQAISAAMAGVFADTKP